MITLKKEQKVICNDCKFWNFLNTIVPIDDNPTKLKYPIGVCRRYPPIHKFAVERNENSSDFDELDNFPAVGSGGWCGEFQSKLETNIMEALEKKLGQS